MHNDGMYGGGQASDLLLQGFTITGVPGDGCAIIWCEGATVDHCIIRDNVGRGIRASYHSEITNCTFVNNQSESVIPLSCDQYTSNMRNCISWSNSEPDISTIYSKTCEGYLNISYSILQFDWYKAHINLDNCVVADPNFADPDNGDFHLKSQMGRWEDFSQQWVKDSVTSPGLDLGDPNDDFSNELWPHGRRINAGAYGNTTEASLSVICKGTPADIDANDSVNLMDYSQFAVSWESNRIPNRNDYNRDNSVGILDLVQLSQDWLTQNVDPVLTLNKAAYAVDETIEVSFSDMPGNQLDWIGICEQGASIEPFAGAMTQWSYTDGTETGTAGIMDGTVSFDGMPAGAYEARIFFDSNYEIKDRVFFTVE